MRRSRRKPHIQQGDCNILFRFPARQVKFAAERLGNMPPFFATILTTADARSRYPSCVWHPRTAFGRRFLTAGWREGVLEPLHGGDPRTLHVAVAQVSSPCQTTQAASATVIRRRRPDGRHAQRRVADAAPLL